MYVRTLSEMDNLLLRNRVLFLVLLALIFVARFLWRLLEPEDLELPDYPYRPWSKEDVPDLMAWEELDWGQGIGHFPELQKGDEPDELRRRADADLSPRRRWKTFMTFRVLLVSILLFLIYTLIVLRYCT